MRDRWRYFWNGSAWRNDDSTLAFEFASLPTPCQLVEVEGDADVRKHYANSLGNYRIQENRWSSGRPVYQLDSEFGLRYLLVKKGLTTWSISPSTTASGASIQSGRATYSPTDFEAAGSVRFGRTRWKYWDGNAWNQGNITVKCLD